ncbi:hypothetical protein F0562_034875 [Nyssa sinensis]|uniref:Bet v I/Major latex protein domain-containing protein n=1 Tax=Nyssa sinensis TaxID=561372 RepID=A0A5J5AA54_9ASTE|nr:hypothetical protein F0562_034875 [Nyssa sinensis]
MGVITFDMEITCSIPPAKMFKAFVLDADNLIPKILPQAINHLKCVKHRVDVIDKENFRYHYSIIEGDALMGILESISYEIKIEATADGGSICKNTSKYHTKGDGHITEEHIKSGKEKASGMFKAVEAYLLANPHAY